MLKKIILILLSIPTLTIADSNIDILKCSNDKDNFSRLACFDKIANSIKKSGSIKIKALTHDIALKSFEEVAKTLEGVEKLEFTNAINTLVYAKMNTFTGEDARRFTPELLKTVNDKTIAEVLALAKNPTTIKLSKEHKEAYLQASNSSNPISEEDVLNLKIDGNSEDSYYGSLAKIMNHKDISDNFMTAYHFLSGDSKAYYKVIDGMTVEQVIRAAEKKKQEQKDYIKNVKIYNIKAKYYSTYSDGKVPGVEFKLKNEGDKTLSDVTVTFYFKDKNGDIIAEDKFYPVNVDSIFSQKDALKPNYVWRQERGKFYTSINVPEEWKTGSVEAKVTKVKFLEAEK